MHETTITIRKLWPPYKPGDKRTTLEDTEGNKYRLDVVYGAGFHDGQVVDIGYTDEENSPEFGGKKYKLIKKMKLCGDGVAVVRPGSTAVITKTAADVGPHLGMWEKRTSELLMEGMAASDIHAHILLCRHIARKGLQSDIDPKPSAPKTTLVKAEFEDDVEDLSF